MSVQLLLELKFPVFVICRTVLLLFLSPRLTHCHTISIIVKISKSLKAFIMNSECDNSICIIYYAKSVALSLAVPMQHCKNPPHLLGGDYQTLSG